MPLCNRVDPFGEIHAAPARGLFTGNRGVLHDPATKTLLKRRWTTRAWIVCALDFGGRRREVMGHTAPSGRAGWTELFFLDEVTALAAGHRPCFLCRREAAKAFAARFPAGPAKAPEMDAVLNAQRRAATGRSVPIQPSAISALPDGAVVALGGKPFAVRSGRLLAWRWTGYGRPIGLDALPDTGAVLLTPAATVETLRNGYRPVWHESAVPSDAPRSPPAARSRSGRRAGAGRGR